MNHDATHNDTRMLPTHNDTRMLSKAIGLVLITAIILAAVIAAISYQLRARIHGKILNRDATVLHSVAQMLIARDDAAWLYYETLGDTTDLRAILLDTSELRGVVGLRIFDSAGLYLEAIPQSLHIETLNQLPEKPTGTYLPDADLADFFADVLAGTAGLEPLLLITMPMLHPKSGDTLGYVQYLIDGAPVQAEFASLDKDLLAQAAIVWSTGTTLAGVFILLTMRRLAHTQEQLEARSRKLLEANAELTLAAKTNAIGAVTAHLLHGLKNPLSGLSEFIASGSSTGDLTASEDWQLAADSARRMQQMIEDIVQVVQQEDARESYEMSLQEVMDLIHAKGQSICSSRGLRFAAEAAPEGVIDSRRCNLLLLIVSNLISNASEALSCGRGEVYVSMVGGREQFTLRVCDNGPGLPKAVKDNLFKPVRSSKAGGSGIGLAISRELAKSMDALLILESTGPGGTTFAIEFSTVMPATKALRIEQYA